MYNYVVYNIKTQINIKMQPINIRNLVMKQLLFQLNDQLDKQRLQINQSLRKAVESIFDHQAQFKIQIAKNQINTIQQQLTLFLFSFTKAPVIWAQLLRNDQISTETYKIIINKPETLTKVYKQIIKQTNSLILQSRGRTKGEKTPDHQTQQNVNKLQAYNFQHEYIDQITKGMVANLLNNLASQICIFYEKGKKIILNQQKQVQQKLKNSQIMNPYYLFGMLKQMSSYTYLKVEQSMSLYFYNLTAETIRNFCRYVQKNYEFVQLVCQEQIPKIFTDQQMHQYILNQNNFWLNFLKNLTDDQVSLKKVKSSRGDSGYMLVKNKSNQNNQQDQDTFNDAQKLILKIGEDNQIRVTNSRASQKKWHIVDIKDSVSNLYKVVKKEVIESAGGTIDKQAIAYGVPLGQYSNIGGSVGKCLADINKYKDANSFFKDLSTSTIIGGSMSYVLSQVPILSYFVIAGGLTYTFYHTFKNKATSKTKKMKQIGKASITAVGSFGSAVVGMMIGQTLIPVPFLGAFVGGVIGGFLGQTGGNLMNKLMSKQSYRNLINYLKDNIQNDKYWKFSHQMLEKLGIDRKYFEQNLCKKEGSQNAYITAICFCVVSSYQAKNYAAKNEKKMKQLQYKKKNKKLEITQEQQIEEQQQALETQFDIVGIVDYLTENNIVLLHQHDQLQNFIRHLSI